MGITTKILFCIGVLFGVAAYVGGVPAGFSILFGIVLFNYMMVLHYEKRIDELESRIEGSEESCDAR